MKRFILIALISILPTMNTAWGAVDRCKQLKNYSNDTKLIKEILQEEEKQGYVLCSLHTDNKGIEYAAIEAAIEANNPAAVQAMLEQKSGLANSKTYSEYDPKYILDAAIGYCCTHNKMFDVVKSLIAKGANPSEVNKKQTSCFTVQGTSLDAVQQLTHCVNDIYCPGKNTTCKEIENFLIDKGVKAVLEKPGHPEPTKIKAPEPTPCVAENATEAFMENGICVIKKCNTGFDEVKHGGKITGCMTPCPEYYKRDIFDKCKKDKCTPDDLAAIGAEEGTWLGDKVGCMATACKDKSITPDKSGKCNKTSGTATKPGTDPKKPATGNDEEFPPIDITQDDACDPNDLPRHAVSGHMQDGKCIVDSCEDKYKVVNNKCEEICSRTAKKAIKHASAYTEYNNDICIPSACEKGYKLEGEKTQNAKCVEVCDAISIAALKTHHATDWKSEGQTCIPTKCEKGFGDSKNNPVNNTCPEQQKSTTTPAPTQAACTTEELAELHATAAVRMVDDGKCAPIKCDTDNGYMLEANECVKKTQNEPAPVGSETPKPTDGNIATTTQPSGNGETKPDNKTGTTTTTITWVHCNGRSQVTTHQFKQDEPGKNITKFDNTTGYTFMGWFYDENYTNLASHKTDIGEINKSLVPIQNPKTYTDIVLYAKCEPTQYKITYNCGQGATGCETCKPQSYTVEQTSFELTCSELKRPGFEFVGWIDKSEGGKAINTLEINQSNPRNITLYADWRSDNAITVHGKLVDEENEPLEFVNIRVVDHEGGDAIQDENGHRLTVNTDKNGEFILRNVPATAKIETSSHVYKQKYWPVQENMTIKLSELADIAGPQDGQGFGAHTFQSTPCGGTEDQNHILQGHTELTQTAKEKIQLLEQELTKEPTERRPLDDIITEITTIRDNKDNIICIPEKCVTGYGDKNNIPTENPETHDLECVQQKPIVITPPPANYGAKCGPTGICPQPRESKVFAELEQQLNRHFSDSSVWKNDEGKFNTARLASDSIAATVLGTVGGVVTSVVMKKSQTKKGFEDMRCTVAGQNVASYGDEFKVGLFAQP